MLRALIVLLGWVALDSCAGSEPAIRTSEVEAPTALRFEPGAPTVGARVQLQYVPPETFRDAFRLRLRARYRTANDGPTNLFGARARYVDVTVLERDEHGRVKGEFVLPDSIVYAIFAVEDLDGSQIDSNASRFWELLIHDGAGNPLYEALLQRANQHMQNDALRMADAARDMVELYPDRAGGWIVAEAAEGRVTPSERWPGRERTLRRELARLDRKMRSRDFVAADDMAGLLWSAHVAEDAAAEAFWRRRLCEEHPGSGWAIEFQAREAYAKHGKDRAGYLADLERLWSEAESGPGVSARWGFNARTALVARGLPAAARQRDAETASRWADRYLAHAPVADPRGEVGLWIRNIPELRDEGLALLRRAVARLDTVTSEDRPIGRTVEVQRQANRRASVQYLRRLGEEFLEDGRLVAAIDTLELAASRAWYPYLRRPLAEAYLAAGDSAEAFRAWAFVAAYGARPEFADTVRERVPTQYDPDRWGRAIEEARADLHSRVMAESINRPVSGSLALTGTDGLYYTFDEIRGGGPAVVVFWSRYCEPSVRSMRDVKRLARRLDEEGVTLLAVTTDTPSDDFTAFLEENGITVPVYHDPDRTFTLAFQNAGTPQFYIVDASGAIRFEPSSSADDARVLVDALLSQEEGL